MRLELPFIHGISGIIDRLPSPEIVSDIYFSDARLSNSARFIWYDQPEGEDEKWLEVLSLKLRHGIQPHYVINPSVWNNDAYTESGIKELTDILDKVWSKGCTWLTLNNPLLLQMSEFRDNIPPFKIKLSINNHISTLEEVQFAYTNSNVRHFVLDRKINRNFDELERIADWCEEMDCSITLLAQESCLPNCIWKNVCDNMIATYQHHDLHEVNDTQNIHAQHLCHAHYDNKSPQDIFKSPTILPSMLNDYEQYVDYIKIAGREFDVERLSSIVRAYANRSDDLPITTLLGKASRTLQDVSLLELQDRGAGAKWKNCKMKCADCDFCDKMYENIVNE